MFNNIKIILKGFKISIYRNLKIIFFFQFISILFSVIYFYNAVTKYTYSSVYQKPYNEVYHMGMYVKKTINPTLSPLMNHYYLDLYYNLVFDENFNLSNDCKVSGYDKNNFFSTKNDTGFSFSFRFAIKPLLTINFKSTDKIKAKKCVEEYLFNLIKFEDEISNELKKIEKDRTLIYEKLQKTVEKHFLELIEEEKKFYTPFSEEATRMRLFADYLNEVKNTQTINFYDSIIISSEYKKENSAKKIYIIIMFIMFGLFVSAIIILIKDYKL